MLHFLCMSRRHTLLLLMGVSITYIVASLLHYGSPFSTLRLATLPAGILYNSSEETQYPAQNTPATPYSVSQSHSNPHLDLGISESIPATTVLAHAPGWTLFRNLYMSNGTLYIVASETQRENLPKIRMMTSTGLGANITPENIAAREPTDHEMQVISPDIAKLKWGGNVAEGDRNRIWTIEGTTFLVNEPWQFLNHYYHFVAELLLGGWAFLYGAFNPNAGLVGSVETLGGLGTTLSPSFNMKSMEYKPPNLSRIIFMHASKNEWRDKPGFNSYFLRAIFSSVDAEVSEDWDDRVAATSMKSMGGPHRERAWHFPVVLLSDRSAAFRGEACGSRTQRIAAESWEFMINKGGLDLFGGWWTAVRESVARFAGVKIESSQNSVVPILSDNDIADPQSLLHSPKQVTITYINRQGVRRHLIPEDHNALVEALQSLVAKKKEEGIHWNLNIVQPELLSKDEQVQLASGTTIMLGVHGNGLTHLVLMNPNKFSTVIEMFYPGGFARDYEWTTRALGMRHYSVWNDTYFTHPNEPPLGYPEGFQGTTIPTHGPTVAKLIEDRLEGRLKY